MSGFQARIVGAGYGRLKILPDVELHIAPGHLLTVLGSNGAGKSTLLRAIMGTISCERRTLSLDGADLSPLPTWRLAHHGMLFVPDGARCFGTLSVGENLHAAFQLVSPGGSLAQALDEAFGTFPVLGAKRDQLAASLSGGERQMLAVGRALLARPKLLVLDEPSAGLSPKVSEEMFAALGEIKRSRGCSVLMAEQNIALASTIADESLVLEEGRVVLSGTIGAVAADQRLRSAYLGL
jgi:branched-chain amino acid transport system ATP-binding protein